MGPGVREGVWRLCLRRLAWIGWAARALGSRVHRGAAWRRQPPVWQDQGLVAFRLDHLVARQDRLALEVRRFQPHRPGPRPLLRQQRRAALLLHAGPPWWVHRVLLPHQGHLAAQGLSGHQGVGFHRPWGRPALWGCHVHHHRRPPKAPRVPCGKWHNRRLVGSMGQGWGLVALLLEDSARHPRLWVRREWPGRWRWAAVHPDCWRQLPELRRARQQRLLQAPCGVCHVVFLALRGGSVARVCSVHHVQRPARPAPWRRARRRALLARPVVGRSSRGDHLRPTGHRPRRQDHRGRLGHRQLGHQPVGGRCQGAPPVVHLQAEPRP